MAYDDAGKHNEGIEAYRKALIPYRTYENQMSLGMIGKLGNTLCHTVSDIALLSWSTSFDESERQPGGVAQQIDAFLRTHGLMLCA
jgi:hypothetical protein